MKKNILYGKIFLFIGLLLTFYGCVESLTDSQKSSSATPSIEISKPVTGDSVKVGDNLITYQAADGTGGSGLSFYEVYVNGKYVKRYEQNTDGTNPKIYITVDSTQIGSKISYYVKVYNKSNKSKQSTIQENIYVKDKVPNAPSGLILTKTNDFAVNLLWNDNSSNENGFELWRKDGGNGTYRRIKTLPSGYISTDDSGLSAFTDYFYKVRAYNTSGPSEFSNEVSTSNIAGGPWNLTAEAIGSSTIRLKWTDFAVNELGFIIERTDPYTNNFERIAIAARGSTEYYDNTVTANTGYRYRVAYYTNSSVSGYSNEVSISTYYTDIQGPSNLTANYDMTNEIVNLSWTDNTNFEKETIIERKTGSGNYVEYATLPASDEQNIKAIDSGIQRGQTYYYRIRQTIANKTYTPYSNEVKVVIPY